MTKRELLEKIKDCDMDAEVIIVDATNYEDTEYEISAVACYPMDVKNPDEINIVINEGLII